MTHRPGRASIAYAVAGHLPPLSLDDGAVLEVPEACVPLGVEIDLSCVGASAELRPDAGVVLFTDGLWEARTVDGNGTPGGKAQFGENGIASVLRRLGSASPQRIVEELRAAAEEFAGGGLADDLCILALRSRP